MRQSLEFALEFNDLPAGESERLDAAAALASAYEKLGQTVFAESWYAAILPAMDENSGEERKTLSTILNNFGGICAEQGRLREGSRRSKRRSPSTAGSLEKKAR
jgi:Tfp pilus assembly protein PilF